MKLEILFKGAKEDEFVTYNYVKTVWMDNKNFLKLLYFEHKTDADCQGQFFDLNDIVDWRIINKDY